MSNKLLVLPAALLALALAACGGQSEPGGSGPPDPVGTAAAAPSAPPADSAEPTEAPAPPESAAPGGPAAPTFDEAWPAEMLPDGFPDLGPVTRVTDSRNFGGRVTIYWNILSADDAAGLVDQLNSWLDNDIAWQGSAYSDGVKYADGTQDEVLKVRVRTPFEFATGQIDPDFDPQFYLEISGKSLPAA